MRDKNATPKSPGNLSTRDSDNGAKRLADRLISIGKDCAAHLNGPFLSDDHADLLYDKNGLPRAQD